MVLTCYLLAMRIGHNMLRSVTCNIK